MKIIRFNRKKYKLEEYLDIVPALKLNQEGSSICYEYNGSRHFILNKELPEYIKTDIILNGKWRIITEC